MTAVLEEMRRMREHVLNEGDTNKVAGRIDGADDAGRLD